MEILSQASRFMLITGLMTVLSATGGHAGNSGAGGPRGLPEQLTWGPVKTRQLVASNSSVRY